ncbi:MAG: ABC transporter permease [Hespellia sp.]|nr:ABC transporter permease [Hespellia sp.]
MDKKSKMKKILHHENTPMLLVLFGIVVVIVILEGTIVRGGTFSQVAFIKGSNIANVLVQISVTGIMAIGMTMVMISGGMDLSCGQMVSFAGCLLAHLVVKTEWATVPAVIAVIVVCVLFQMAMGIIISRTKLEPFIVSLGFMSIYQGLSYLITQGREITMGDQLGFIKNMKISFGENRFYLGMSVMLLIALTIIMWLILKYSKYGRWVYAVGGNESAAYLAGIPVKKFKVALYGFNGLFISIATLTLLARVGAGSPPMGSGKEIDVIAAVVVGGTALAGGKGNMWGTFIGVLLLGSISNALNILGVSPYYQYIMKGLLILVSIYIGYIGGKKKTAR